MCWSENIVGAVAVAVGADIHDPRQVEVMMAVAIPIPYRDDDDGGGYEDGGVDDDMVLPIQLLIEQNIALREQVQLGKKIIGAMLILMIICIIIFIMNILHFTYIS
jgi:hypothetical protein